MLTSPEVSGGTSWVNVDISKLTVKIGDFGLSRPFDSMRQRETTLTVTGTLDMMAPEIKEPYLAKESSARYSEKSHIWSCGMLAYQTYQGRLPSKYYLVKVQSHS